MGKQGSSDLLLPPPLLQECVCVPGEGCVVETERRDVPPALGWAGFSGTPGWQP